MKGMLRVMGGGLVVLLASCLVFASSGARDVYVAPGHEEAIQNAVWEVGSVRVEKSVGSGALEEEVRSILRIVLARNTGCLNITGSVPETEAGRRGQEGFTLDTVIREREFMRDYRALNAVSVELNLYGPDGLRPVAVALYSENTRDTIDSHPYLYALIRRALRLFR